MLVPSRSTVRVDQTTDLAAIYEPHLNVVVLERTAHDALQAYARRVADDVPFSFKATAAFEQDDGLVALDELARALPADDARDVLVEDLAYWIEVMTELTGSRRVGLRLVSLRAPMCPAFHVDHVPVRLVCTYCGSGTEWLDAGEVERCRPLDVLLLKGTAWSENRHHGARHRSPPAATPRLLLTIDPLG